MMIPVPTPPPGSEFNKFLYASAGEDGNGMPLTVLSALARMDVDPWEEASRLTNLSRELAATQLARLLGALPNARSASQDPTTIAIPLVALLPCARDRSNPPGGAVAPSAPTEHTAVVSRVRSVLAYLMLILFFQLVVWSLQLPKDNHPSPASSPKIDAPVAPASSDGPHNSVR